jgi:hypothetical protein
MKLGDKFIINTIADINYGKIVTFLFFDEETLLNVYKVDDYQTYFFDNELIPYNESPKRYNDKRYTPPFRLGKKQKRAVLDANGIEVTIFPSTDTVQAQLYVDYLNGK